MDEFGSASDLNDAQSGPSEMVGMSDPDSNHNQGNSSGSATATKRKKLKRRRKLSNGSGLLHSISSGGNSRTTSVRKKKGTRSSRKNKVRKRRLSSDGDYQEMDDYASSEPYHDSEAY